MSHFILECPEGSKTAGQIVSHFYKVENSVCTCVFCGTTIDKNFFNTALNQNNFSNPYVAAVGQRS